MSQLIRSWAELQQYLVQRYGEDVPVMPTVAPELEAYPLRLSDTYADRIDWHDEHDPLRRMVLPSPEEGDLQPYELTDPIGDHAREVVPGLIHRYPDRCLLLLTTHCRIHCRFCFRREVVGRVRPVNFFALREYLAEHTEVHELIFSGGDPFTFPVGFVKNVKNHLLPLSHIHTWRFHTRVPVADPQSVSDAFLAELPTQEKRVVVVLHVDHVRELDAASVAVIEKLRQAGCVLLSQSVLLKGVNDTREDLELLFRRLIEVGVKPYYLHHPDKVVGTSHFRISLERGKQLYRSLRGHLSSIALPEYVLDLPGGFGKVPVFWLESQGAGRYLATTFRGETIEYLDPGEKSESQ